MTAADLMPFAYEGAELRTVIIDGEPWFVAADVARILEYRMASDMTRRLDEEDRGTRSVRTPSGEQQMTIISEAGFYAAILGSQCMGAKAIKRWLTHEVLPAIRKTGGYGQAVERLTPLEYARQLVHAEERAEHERAGRQLAESRVAELEPKADAFDAFLNGEGLYLIGTVARMIGLGQTTMFRFLYEQRVLMESGPRRKQPYANPKFDGWFGLKPHDQSRTNGHAVATTMVTPRGAEGIRLLAIDKGLIEPALIGLPSLMKEIGA